MTTLKTIGTFAIIIGCFAIIYPRFLHPMVLLALGVQPNPPKQEDSMYPPHMRHGPVPKDRRPPPMPNDPKDIRQHMRPGPHPGMRAAAEMQKQQSQGGGRGMMGIVLPMYAIGICVYLVYTLFKVFNKRGKTSDPYKRQYETDGRVDRLGFPQGLHGLGGGEDGEVQRFLQQKQQERELEDLLVKMDDTRNVSEDEMRALQKRLEETEEQMTRILQAMQTMQSRVTTVGAAGAAGSSSGDLPSDKAAEGKAETVGSTTAPSHLGMADKTAEDNPSAESSPVTESYEIVKNSAAATSDASPNSEVSSPSSFEQIGGDQGREVEQEDAGENTDEGEGGEDILLDQQEDKTEEEESGVRHRKSGHTEQL